MEHTVSVWLVQGETVIVYIRRGEDYVAVCHWLLLNFTAINFLRKLFKVLETFNYEDT